MPDTGVKSNEYREIMPDYFYGKVAYGHIDEIPVSQRVKVFESLSAVPPKAIFENVEEVTLRLAPAVALALIYQMLPLIKQYQATFGNIREPEEPDSGKRKIRKKVADLIATIE